MTLDAALAGHRPLAIFMEHHDKLFDDGSALWRRGKLKQVVQTLRTKNTMVTSSESSSVYTSADT